jgi:hypothetical protein
MISRAFSGGSMRQMLFQIVQIFLSQNAVGINNAKTLDQLGVRPPGQENEPQKPANYPAAPRMLIQAGIIRTADNDRLYLSEEYSPSQKKDLTEKDRIIVRRLPGPVSQACCQPIFFLFRSGMRGKA